ncbi:MAG TPA: acyltransferase [Edaphobacter sp.]|nr:acyltransferase [Edaphobacter sp.]
MFKPIVLGNPQHVHIGKNVSIRQGARIEAIIANASRTPELRIGDNVNIEQNVHLVCHSRITIGRDVSITGNCAIVDVTHPYADINDPVKIGMRILDEDSFVVIGDGCFLGFGALIMPNVRIGKYCIIGAHSVVTKDIPDYCVVAGNPARVLRRYDVALGEWLAPQ